MNNRNPIYNRSDYDEYVIPGIKVIKFGWINDSYFMNESEAETETCKENAFLNTTQTRKIKDNYLCAKDLNLSL